MLSRFGHIIGVVATMAKVLRVTARQSREGSPTRTDRVRQIRSADFFPAVRRTAGSHHRYDLTACVACRRCADNCPGGCIHVGEERIPGRRGLQITSYTIDYARCLGCGLCSRSCPSGCLVMGPLRGLQRHSRDGETVDFSRLPVEVAWGTSARALKLMARLKVIARSVQ